MNSKTVNAFLIGIIVFIPLAIFGSNFVIDRVANQVIQKLQRGYSPSPYGPGLDPDKIDTSKLKAKI